MQLLLISCHVVYSQCHALDLTTHNPRAVRMPSMHHQMPAPFACHMQHCLTCRLGLQQRFAEGLATHLVSGGNAAPGTDSHYDALLASLPADPTMAGLLEPLVLPPEAYQVPAEAYQVPTDAYQVPAETERLLAEHHMHQAGPTAQHADLDQQPAPVACQALMPMEQLPMQPIHPPHQMVLPEPAARQQGCTAQAHLGVVGAAELQQKTSSCAPMHVVNGVWHETAQQCSELQARQAALQPPLQAVVSHAMPSQQSYNILGSGLRELHAQPRQTDDQLGIGPDYVAPSDVANSSKLPWQHAEMDVKAQAQCSAEAPLPDACATCTEPLPNIERSQPTSPNSVIEAMCDSGSRPAVDGMSLQAGSASAGQSAQQLAQPSITAAEQASVNDLYATIFPNRQDSAALTGKPRVSCLCLHLQAFTKERHASKFTSALVSRTCGVYVLPPYCRHSHVSTQS